MTLDLESPFADEFAQEQFDSGFDSFDDGFSSDEFESGFGKPFVDESHERESIAAFPDSDRYKEGEDEHGFPTEMEEDEGLPPEWGQPLVFEGEEPNGGASHGVSPIAIASIKEWPKSALRKGAWLRAPYGLVVHTTGGGAPGRAEREGVSPTQWAVRYYKRTRGTHYVNGWGGAATGDLVQVASDRIVAWGVGMGRQRRSIRLGRFETDLPRTVVRLWRRRWTAYSTPLAMLPKGADSVNSIYVHVECPPCVYSLENKRRTGAQPMRPGLRFTKAQHDSVAVLAHDLANRHGWSAEDRWWRTPRLVGHEDVSPITRSNGGGGWDPGALRDEPYFDWEYIYAQIERLESQRGGRSPWSRVREPWDRMKSALGEVARQFFELARSGRESEAVRRAIASGQRDENTLTNLLFFTRHPERGNKPISKSDRHLAMEWIEIRNRTVRPLLAGPARDVHSGPGQEMESDDYDQRGWSAGHKASEFEFDEELQEVFMD